MGVIHMEWFTWGGARGVVHVGDRCGVVHMGLGLRGTERAGGRVGHDACRLTGLPCSWVPMHT